MRAGVKIAKFSREARFRIAKGVGCGDRQFDPNRRKLELPRRDQQRKRLLPVSLLLQHHRTMRIMPSAGETEASSGGVRLARDSRSGLRRVNLHDGGPLRQPAFPITLSIPPCLLKTQPSSPAVLRRPFFFSVPVPRRRHHRPQIYGEPNLARQQISEINYP